MARAANQSTGAEWPGNDAWATHQIVLEETFFVHDPEVRSNWARFARARDLKTPWLCRHVVGARLPS